MIKATIFMRNCNQIMRLSKSVALPDDVTQVNVIAVGRTRILTPFGEDWSSWFDEPGVSNDFEREQPTAQER